MRGLLIAAGLAAALAMAGPLTLHAAPSDAGKEAAKTETGASAPARSDNTKTEAKDEKKGEKKGEKKLTPQQQKMKDCGAKWQEEKKAKGVKGRAAYRKFLSTCLKKERT